MTAKKTEVKRVVKAALMVIKISDIQFDLSYQRGVVPKHKKIALEFDEEALGIPLIGQRDDGTFWCVDGRQRITALELLGKSTVRAEVFKSNGPEHEAAVFRKVNQNRTKLSPLELFHAMLTEGDKDAWELKKLVESVGYIIVTKPSGSVPPDKASKTILCINTLMRIYKKYGSDVLLFALELSKTWPDDPLRVKCDIFTGLSTFFIRHEKNVDVDRLKPRLLTTTPAKLLYSAQMGIGDRGSNVADVLEVVYRKRSTGKR